MKNHLLLCFFLLFNIAAHSQSNSVDKNLPTTIVDSLRSESADRSGFTRLRINLTSNHSDSDELVRIAGVSVCSATACYEAGAPSSVRISSTTSGLSSPVIDMEIPLAEVISVRFKAIGGSGLLQGSINLPTPLKLEAGFRGGDILVVVQKKISTNNSNLIYEPVAAASNYLPKDSGVSIYYNPKFSTKTTLPLGVVFSIPAGAHASPQILVASVHDTGDDYPMFNLYPQILLAKPASVQMAPIARSAQALRSDQSGSTPKPRPLNPRTGNTTTLRQSNEINKPVTIEIRSTGGTVQPNNSLPWSPKSQVNSDDDQLDRQIGNSGVATSNAAAPNCFDIMAYQPNRNIWLSDILITGTVYLNWCTGIAPYAHITITNMNDPRELFVIKSSPKVALTPGNIAGRFPLTRIATWGVGTQVLLNGFTWAGDEGTNPGQFGKALGYVSTANNPGIQFTELGANVVGGGTCNDIPNATIFTPCSSDGNKRVFRRLYNGSPFGSPGQWYDNSSVTLTLSSPRDSTIISSSTSIVKNGVCTNANTSSRWSAVGATPNGYLIFVSSTSSSETTGTELCRVFQGLGAFDAIRLDGGPSAAMVLDNFLLNPLQGLYFLKYGNMRYIPYALKVSYSF